LIGRDKNYERGIEAEDLLISKQTQNNEKGALSDTPWYKNEDNPIRDIFCYV
jgi:hypothetical protein